MTTITLEVPEHLAHTLNEIGDQLPLVLEMGISRYAPLSTKAYVEAITFLTQDPQPAELVAFLTKWKGASANCWKRTVMTP